MATVDLNADVGESYGRWTLGDDAALLPLITSANVACGFHAGDPLTLRRTLELAAEHEVVVGAQVSYPDLLGFGRREMVIPPDELSAIVLYQLAALDGLGRVAGAPVRYVKPHGALYHRALTDQVQAGAIAQAVLDYSPSLALVTMAGSALAVAAAERGLRVITEGYADRAYLASGTLVPRGEPGAVHTDGTVIARQAVTLAATVDSLCLHGDTPGAAAHAVAVLAALDAAGIEVAPFVGEPGGRDAVER